MNAPKPPTPIPMTKDWRSAFVNDDAADDNDNDDVVVVVAARC